MADIFSKIEPVIMHYKDGKPAAFTLFNGHAELYTVGEPMTRKEHEQFYETQHITEHGK